MAKAKGKSTYSIVLYIAIILFLFGFVLLVLGLLRMSKRPPQILTFEEYNAQVPLSTPYKTYVDKKYNFSVQYPGFGYVRDPECETENKNCDIVEYSVCGNAIKTTEISGIPVIGFDNWFTVSVTPFAGTIIDYLASINSENQYETTSVLVQGADEAISIGKPLSTNDQNTFSPLAYTSYLIRKNNTIFNVMGLQNPGIIDGCLPPSGSGGQPNQFKGWNVAESFTFF